MEWWIKVAQIVSMNNANKISRHSVSTLFIIRYYSPSASCLTQVAYFTHFVMLVSHEAWACRIPCNAASRPTVIDKDQPIKSLGSMRRDEVSTARLHLKMVFAHGPTLVGRQRCMG